MQPVNYGVFFLRLTRRENFGYFTPSIGRNLRLMAAWLSTQAGIGNGITVTCTQPAKRDYPSAMMPTA